MGGAMWSKRSFFFFFDFEQQPKIIFTLHIIFEMLFCSTRLQRVRKARFFFITSASYEVSKPEKYVRVAPTDELSKE